MNSIYILFDSMFILFIYNNKLRKLFSVVIRILFHKFIFSTMNLISSYVFNFVTSVKLNSRISSSSNVIA